MVMKREKKTSPPPWWFRPLVYLGAALAGVALMSVASAQA